MDEEWHDDILWLGTEKMIQSNLPVASAMFQDLATRHAPTALSYAMVAVIEALLTETPEHIAEANVRLNKAEQLAMSVSETQTMMSRMKNWKSWGNSLWGAKKQQEPADPPLSFAKLEANLALAEVYLLKTLLLVKTSKFVKGALMLRYSWKQYEKTSQLFKEAEERESFKKMESEHAESPYPEEVRMPYNRCEALREDLNFGLGCFHFFVSLIPKAFLWMVEAVGFTADRDRGFQELLSCQDARCFRAPMASLILLWIFVFFLEDLDQAHQEYEKLLTYYSSPVYHLYFGGYINRMMGDMEKARSCFESIAENSEIAQLKLAAKYELGWCWYLHLDFEKASALFQDFLDETRAPSFRAFCAYQLGICYFFLDQPEKAKDVLSRIPEWARKHYSYDVYALRKGKQFLEEGMSKFQKSLILADIRHQNRQYAECLSLLEGEDGEASTTDDERALYYYMLGLANAGLELMDEAKENFEKTIDLQASVTQELFVVPYSYVELGDIYQEKGDLEEARQMYGEVERFQGFDFEKPLLRRLKLAQDKMKSKKAKNNNARSTYLTKPSELQGAGE